MDLAAAIRAGDLETVRALAPEGAAGRDDRGLSLVLLALFHRQREAAEVLLAAGAEVGVLEAAALGRADRLRELLPEGLGARTPEGFTPLGLAAFLGGADAVRVLLEAGADPNGDADNELGVRPVHSAAAAGDAESLRLLLEAGADPDVRQPGGFTPLDAAARSADPALERVLLEHGARARSAPSRSSAPAPGRARRSPDA